MAKLMVIQKDFEWVKQTEIQMGWRTETLKQKGLLMQTEIDLEIRIGLQKD